MKQIDSTRTRRVLLQALLAAGLVSAVSAQEKNRYLVVTYYSVPQGKTQAFEEHMRTNTSKIIRAMMDSGQSQMVAWALQRPQYRGSNPPEWNYVASWISDGPPGTMAPAAMEAAYQKATGMTQPEYLNKINNSGLYTVAGNELYREVASTPGPPPAFNNVFLFKAREGQRNELEQRIRTMMAPIAADRVKDGVDVSFAAWRLVSPIGDKSDWDFVLAYGHKDLAGAIEPGGGSGAARFMKVHPDKNYSEFISRGRDLSGSSGQMILRVIEHLRK